jgi:uncharacterized protein YndB with AHSA1/START domain
MKETATMDRSVQHGTLVLERLYDAAPARVFAAWADVEARKRWGPPGVEYEFLESDFSLGGRDVSRCGPAGDLPYMADLVYCDIVPDRRIVFAATVSRGGVRLSCALTTIELQPRARRTRLVLTEQIAALDGSGMVAGHKEGWSAGLDRLVQHLARQDKENAK